MRHDFGCCIHILCMEMELTKGDAVDYSILYFGIRTGRSSIIKNVLRWLGTVIDRCSRRYDLDDVETWA